ncbi:MAG: prenyltransferase [Bacteroidales bacterium]|nr:prenyltransferase [Bacteroidales bacterium]
MSRIVTWCKNGRDVALVQSLMPAVVAAVFAIGNPSFRIIPAFLAIIGVGAAHLAANILDDYFDYKADMLSDRDKVVRKGFRAMMVKYPYLTDGSQTLATTRKAIANFAIVALLCGGIIFAMRTLDQGFLTPGGSWWIIALTAVTAFLAYFYSAPPLKIAYHGLGELEIGLIFGPLLMTGVYYSACGSVDWSIAFISVPLGILVLNILFTHSFIDMEGDRECGKMTFALLLGSKKACLIASLIINTLPYIIIITAISLKILHPLYLLTLLAAGRSVWLCASLVKFYHGDPSVPAVPPRWLGPMMKDWNQVREAGIDWFLMRWMTARNIISTFCLMTMVTKIILTIIAK